MLPALFPGGLPLPPGVVSRAVTHAAPAPFSPRRATGGAVSRLAPPLGPRSPGCAEGRLRSLLRYRGLAPGKPCCCWGGTAKIRGRHPGLRSAPRGTASAARRRTAPGGPGAAPWRHRGCGAHGGSAPPPAGEARSASPRRWAGGRAFAGGRKEKKKSHTHTCTKNAFSVCGGSEGSRCRCADERAGELEDVSEPPRHPPASPLLRTGPDRTAPGLRGARRGWPGAATTRGGTLRRSQLPGGPGRVRPAGGCARRGAGRYLWRRAAFICI